MRRRAFISLFAGMAAACSLAAQAQGSATMGTTKLRQRSCRKSKWRV
jgi:hypothetical protein